VYRCLRGFSNILAIVELPVRTEAFSRPIDPVFNLCKIPEYVIGDAHDEKIASVLSATRCVLSRTVCW